MKSASMLLADLYALFHMTTDGKYPTTWDEKEIGYLKQEFEYTKQEAAEFFKGYLAFCIVDFLNQMRDIYKKNSYSEGEKIFDGLMDSPLVHKYGGESMGFENSPSDFSEYYNYVHNNYIIILSMVKEIETIFFVEEWFKILEAFKKMDTGSTSMNTLDMVAHLMHVSASILSRLTPVEFKKAIDVLNIKFESPGIEELTPYVSPQLRKYVAVYDDLESKYGLAFKVMFIKKSVTMRDDAEEELSAQVQKPLNINDIDDMLESLHTSIEKIGKYVKDNYTETDFILPLVEFDTEDDSVMGFYFGAGDDLIPALQRIAKEITDKFRERWGEELGDVEIRFGKSHGLYSLLAVKK